MTDNNSLESMMAKKFVASAFFSVEEWLLIIDDAFVMVNT